MFSCCAKNGEAIFSTTTEHSFIVKKSFWDHLPGNVRWLADYAILIA